MSTDTKIKTLIFNKLTQEQYNNADIVPTEFYLTPDTSIDSSEKGAANGVASLDTNGKVPTEQIPTATTSTLGGVKPDGTTITVTEDGVISAPSNYDYVVESKTPTADDPTWYRKYKSGWLEQGGLAYASSGDAAVTLLKPYADTGFAIIATNEQTSNINAFGWIYISSKTTTGFTIKSRKGNGEAVTCNAMWESKGQGAE